MTPAAQLGRKFEPRALIILPVIVILLAAAAARFHRLGAQSLWYDEGLAYGHSLRTPPELISHLNTNVHVPAYFTLLRWWRELTGSSEFALRMLSALFSILSVAWVYALGARLKHPIAGLAAAALVTLNSFSVYYAQEARMYAMLTAIAAGSMWLFIGLLRPAAPGAGTGSARRRIIGLGLVNALGIYTHFAQSLVIMAQVALATLLFCASLFSGRAARLWTPLRWRRWLNVMLAQLITLILFSPWLPVAIAQLGNRSHRLRHAPVEELLSRILGFLAYGSAYEFSLGYEAIIIFVLLVLGLLPATGARREWWSTLLPVAWVVTTIGVYLSVGLGGGYLRFLLPAQLAFALWLGRGAWVCWQLSSERIYGIARVLPKFAAALAMVLYLVALFRGLDALYHNPDFQRDDMRGLARQIEADLRAGDAIIVSAPGLQELLRYYYRSDAPVYPLPMASDVEAMEQEALDIIAAHDRLHVIFYGAEQQDPNLIVETTLNMNAFEISDRWIDDLRYARYAGKTALAEPRQVDLVFGGEIALDSFALSATVVDPGDDLLAQLVWTAIESPGARYKVFLQLLDDDGALVAQRDSEPAGGSLMTIAWKAGDSIVDNHGLLIPADIAAGEYRLIAGLYDINDPAARLRAGDSSYAELATIEARGAG